MSYGNRTLEVSQGGRQRPSEKFLLLKVSFFLIGLIAAYLCCRAACMVARERSSNTFYALALFPSVLFWSSILGKDSLVLLAQAREWVKKTWGEAAESVLFEINPAALVANEAVHSL